MKKQKFLIVTVFSIVVFVLGPLGGAVSAQAEGPTPEEMEAAIQAGLTWLVNQQNPDGSWYGYERVAHTGLVLLKLETRAIELGLDPLGSEYEYAPNVQNGLNFILANSHVIAISMEPAGDPDGNGNGIGVYFTDWSGHEIYNTGIAMMALAASGHPEIYGETLQDAVDFMSFAQADPECGLHRGGWRYGYDYCDSDNSNSGYATLGLGYAQAPPPYGFGLTVPQWVKDEHNIWIDVIQDDVNGDPDDGGSWYDPFWSWVNILKTGNLLYEMGLVGDDVDTPRVQDAVHYIERHWFDPNSDPGWRDHRQAMFTMMKGFEGLGIEYIDLDGDGVAEHDWFAEVAQHLIDTQLPDGSWPWDYWGDPILSTAWALLTLEKSVPSFDIPVAVDIKPGSCPNPLNTTEKGNLPVAILGLPDFDVTKIDPASVILAGVAPLRWSYEDAGMPYEPFTGKQDRLDCLEYCPDEFGIFDGYLDLSLKFSAQEVVAALGEVYDGDVLVLQLTGQLKEEFGGTMIVGEDVVWIIEK